MKYIDLCVQDEIAIIKINRPEALNAMNVDVIDELSSTIDRIDVDNAVKVVIITGAGERAFCAGADIAFMVNINPIEAEKYASSAQMVLSKIEKLGKPVIAAVNGFALGGGCELAMVCDIRIASSNAKMGQPEVTIGIPPGWGGTQRLMRLVGPSRAKELVFSGKMISAEQAFQIGLINQMVSLTADELPPELPQDDLNGQKERSIKIAKTLNAKLISETISLCKEITKNSQNAIKISKMLINKGMDSDLETGLRLEIYGWALSFAHEDREKLMSAFLNKSKK
ncbi:MAG: enoyl-CoA hydratase-related protein [Nitrososphaeraceae archaeon]